MHRHIAFAAALAALLIGGPALAATYPVSGDWTYNYSAEKGPAKECGPRHMEFRGERRFDTGGSVPDYRIESIEPSGSSEYRITDTIFTGPVQNAHVDYTLRLIDNDHIELKLMSGGILLRRCP